MAEQSNKSGTDKPVQMLKSLALERGLDAVELEKEGRENGFVVTISGMPHVVVEKYDAFVDEQIAKARPRKKPKTRRNLSNTDSKGVLKIHLNKFPDRIAEAEKEIKRLNREIQQMPDGIERKQFTVTFNKEGRDLAKMKRTQIEADKRINFLLDLEIAETELPETVEDKKQEEK